MDRTIIDTYRAEEKVLSEQVHKKLETLMLFHQPTFEFKKLFAEGLFLKPNQKAFFHVMHFLLTLFDLNEFKRRFYWPIADKKSEGIFRTSIVDYMTYINKKYNLQWKHQWNYLVQMPGGIKFLTFLMELTDFITREIVKQKEKYLADKNYKLEEPFGKSLLTKLKLRHQCFKINSLHYVESLDNATKKCKDNSEIIKNTIDDILQKREMYLGNLLSEEFVKNFGDFSNEVLKTRISSRLENIAATEDNLKIIRKNIEIFDSQKNKLKYDVEKLVMSAKSFFPQEEIISKNEINFLVLSKVFVNICPFIDNLLKTFDENSLSVFNYEETELKKLNGEVLQLDTEVKKLLTNLNYEYENIAKNKDSFALHKNNALFNSNLAPKLLCTPPITHFNNNQVQFRHCLPLMESVSPPTIEEFTFANNQTTVMFPQSARKLKNDTKNNSKNQSNKILDPSVFLRSLKKTSKKKSNLLNKTQDASLAEIKNQQVPVCLIETEIETNAKLCFAMSKTVTMIESPIYAEKPEFSKRKLFLDRPHKLSKAIKGSPNFLLNGNPLDLSLTKMSTSPSGRLDPLIKFDKNSFTKIMSDLEVLELDDDAIIAKGADTSGTFNITDVNDSLFNVSDSILKDLPV
ncbi:augmin complex subunit dgt6 [Condylostylus longicornis]|uniref:augmin complex subunit dgt6 n=1 Tax=Condylostylus longicornis TaxID=2530218 RepID=UPI00244E2C18|nr:augmin complex subunit dgt6 [Condylostylus longicornis]XP_055377776.1 augmin complex subunit dgt6 [Condylostylus longicornis]